ncbi:helix-turn-helix transcriptional regulator [Streptomyces marianii]|uniref:Helix-turn-helix transcriptional regulator n=1 Tax=Streptomyces marianii TaxID=1817406 RepID=A0A5R9EGY9_9ACTN|nr:LuxR C-terminal-related transcriptional regulator [Streptomyces marianii]TLQ47762.1 helix-turn-helix transcriptional regulator [Streptomyces marianii]
MSTPVWERRLRRTLASETAEPLLVLAAGAAGTGKSHLARRLADLPEATGAEVLTWTCGEGAAAPEPAGDGPVLLLVDDLHRADAAERSALRLLLERSRPSRATVVLYRPEELPHPGLPLGTPPLRYPRDMVVLEHRVTPWTTEQVQRTAAAALGDRCSPEAVVRLHEQSGGVAQVVTDLLVVLGERDLQRYTAADVDAAGVPVRLAELALSRTASLPASQRAVVWAAAVLGEPVTREELLTVAEGATSGRPPGGACENGTAPAGRAGRNPVLDDALAGALDAAVLAEYAGLRYGWPVPLAARAVRRVLPGPVRQELHARAADVLVRRQPVPWMSLARHRREAGRVKAWLRAVERAAALATGAGDHQAAIKLLEEALASPEIPRAARAGLAPRLADIAVNGLRSDQTVEVLSQIVEDESLPAVLRGEIRLDLGLLLCNQVGMGGTGWTELERAAAELRSERPGLSARAMSALAMPYWPGSSIDVHRAWLEGAAVAADDSGDEVVRTAVRANRAGLAMSCGDPEGWDLLKSLPTDHPDPGIRRHAARGLCNAADSAVWLGHFAGAEDLLHEGLELSARSGAPYTEHTALGARLLLEWFTGRWAGLAERCEEFVAATADMPVISADARMVRGMLALAQGDWGAALSWLAGPDASSAEHAAAPHAAATSGALIRLALARQDVPAAAEEAGSAWRKAAAKGVWVWAAELAPWAVEAVARAGEVAAARAMVEELSSGLAGVDAPSATAALSWSRAALAEVDGRPLDAVPLYREAAAAFDRAPRPYARALAAEGAARCTLEAFGADVRDSSERQDDPGAAAALAVDELTSCTALFTELGAVWDAARARAVLRRHQPAKEGRPPGRPAYGGQLSPREREVAELAAAGLTNKEIAGILHLSPRTVEQHVARAMRKQGTPSRQELAEWRGPAAPEGPERTRIATVGAPGDA